MLTTDKYNITRNHLYTLYIQNMIEGGRQTDRQKQRQTETDRQRQADKNTDSKRNSLRKRLVR